MTQDSFSTGKFATTQTLRGGVRRQITLDSWSLDYGQPAWYRVIHGDVCLDVYTSLSGPRRPLLVMAQDALVEHRLVLPWFYRAKWRHQFQEWNMMTFNDPTLYEDRQMRAGYLMKPGARELLNAAIERLQDLLGIEEADIVHYGASAGGYQVLTNAPHFPNAAHVVDIPRIHFDSSFATDNMEIITRATGATSVPSVMETWREFPSWPTIRHITYLQNSADVRFVRTQLPSFLSLLAEAGSSSSHGAVEDFRLRFYDVPGAKRGHTPLPEERTIPLLRELLAAGRHGSGEARAASPASGRTLDTAQIPRHGPLREPVTRGLLKRVRSLRPRRVGGGESGTSDRY